MIRLRIYSRKECHLCEEAYAAIDRIASEYPLAVEVIDVDRNPEDASKYGEEVPVVLLEDTKLFKYRVDEQKLRKAVEARLKGDRGIA